MKTKDIVFCGISTALLCVISPISIPIFAVPFTLATLVIYMIAGINKPVVSVTSVLLFITLGCLGLPVFSGLGGGITHILNPSGGFILGYIPLVITIILVGNSGKRYILGMITGTVLLYVCGCAGYVLSTGCDIRTLISVCILPFLPLDISKIILACVITPRFKRIICKY